VSSAARTSGTPSSRTSYDATLVSDAHTTEDLSPWGAPPPALVIAHTNLYWGNHEAPGRAAGTVEAKDVDFAAR
jgi:hypothetical protein